jgi:cytochrome c-type biogenesis protein CcmH
LKIQAGEEPEAIRAWLVASYGDYVSYAPQVTRLTWPLFAAPLFLMLLAGVLLRRRFMRRAA